MLTYNGNVTNSQRTGGKWLNEEYSLSLDMCANAESGSWYLITQDTWLSLAPPKLSLVIDWFLFSMFHLGQKARDTLSDKYNYQSPHNIIIPLSLLPQKFFIQVSSRDSSSPAPVRCRNASKVKLLLMVKPAVLLESRLIRHSAHFLGIRSNNQHDILCKTATEKE